MAGFVQSRGSAVPGWAGGKMMECMVGFTQILPRRLVSGMLLVLLFVPGPVVGCAATRAKGPSAPGGKAEPPRPVEQGRPLSLLNPGNGRSVRAPVGLAGRGKQPLKVTYRSPEGSVDDVTAVLVSFSEPMVALSPMGTRSFPVVVRPVQPAERRWISGDTAKIAFKKSLPFATRFVVEVPASVESLLGNRLSAPVTWAFETPRVRLGSVVSMDVLVGKSPLVATFNQPVALGELRAKVSVTLDGKPWPVTWRREERANASQALIVPVRPWPAGGHKILVVVPKGFVGVQGPLGTKNIQSAALRTVGPLQVRLTCHDHAVDDNRGCWPVANDIVEGLGLFTTTPVDRRALVAALRIQPSVGDLSRLLVPVANLCDKGRVCAKKWRVTVPLRPQTVYRVSVSDRLQDIYKEPLSSPLYVRFKTMPRPPGLFLSRSATGYLAPGEKLPVSWRSGDLSVRSWHAADGPSAAALLSCLAAGKKDAVLSCLRHLPSRKAHFSGRKTRRVTQQLSVGPGLSLWHFRLEPERSFMPFYQARAAWETSGWLAGWRLVQATDLAVHVRATPFDLLVWVTDMKTGMALSGVSVRLWNHRGRMLLKGRTSTEGLVRFSMKAESEDWKKFDRRGFVVTADLGSRKALVLLGAWNAPWQEIPFSWMADPMAHFGATYRRVVRQEGTASGWGRDWTGNALVYRGWLGTERRIYRPGDEVFVQGAIRGFRTWRPVSPGILRASLVLIGPFNAVLGQTPVRLGPMGAFEARMPVPPAARLGYYRIELRKDGKHLASSSFRVANFVPPSFWVRAVVPRSLGPDEDIPLEVLSRTYAKAPMDHAPVHIEGDFEWASLGFEPERFFAGRLDWLASSRKRTWYRADDYLDGKGRLSATIPHPRGNSLRMRFLTYENVSVQVMSRGGRTQSASASLMRWPADLVVGIRSSKPAHPRRYQIAVFGKDERRHKAKVTVHLVSVKERGSNWKIDWSSRLWSRTLQVGMQGARVTFPNRRFPGRWVLVVFSVTDGKGRQSWTTDLLDADPVPKIGSDQSAGPSGKAPYRLLVSIPNKRYRPGETAHVTVTRRGKVGQALLLVERERIFDVLPIRFGRKKSVTIPLRVKEAHALSVNVVALATVPNAAYRPGRKSLLAGQGVLKVDERQYALRVVVDPDKSVHGPGDLVGVSVRVADRSGRPVRAAVVVTAVDAAVLALAGSGQFDPTRSLFNVPARQVRAYDLRLSPFDSRIRMLEVPPSVMLAGSGTVGYGAGYGGLGGRGRRSMVQGTAVRRRFVTTPWQELLVTDGEGLAHGSFRLPDNLTTFRLLAVAFDAGRRSGLGRGKVVVTKPLFALANLPRQVRVGDRFLSGVTVYNQTKQNLRLRVTANVGGSVVRLRNREPKTVTIPAEESGAIRFAFWARRAGRAIFRFDVCTARRCDRLERALSVSLPTIEEARSIAGSTSRSVVHHIGPMPSVLSDRGGLDVELSSSLLVGLEPGLSKLVAYPFDCSEQSLSKLVGAMAVAGLMPRGLKIHGLPQGTALRKLIRGNIQSLVMRWNRDGGLPMWPGGSSSVWATAYGIIVLDLARRKGFFHPARDLFQKATAYLERALSGLVAKEGAGKSRHRTGASKPGRGRAYSPRAAALAALALSRLGKGEAALGVVDALHRRHQDRACSQRSLLMAAMAPWVESASHRRLMSWYRKKVESRIRAQGPSAHVEPVVAQSWWPFDSMVRDTALALLALVTAEPRHPMIDRLARWLVLDRTSAEFRTTQEAAWSLMALWAQARRDAKGELSAGLWLGRRLLVRLRSEKGRVARRSAHVAMRRILDLIKGAGGRVVVASKGRVFYTMRLSYFRDKLPDRPSDRGFSIRRRVDRLDRTGRIVSGTPRFGDLVLVTLDVATRQAHRFVAIQDPLPGGLEPVDLQLRTATRSWGVLKHLAHVSWFDHRELRDDRVLFFVDNLRAGRTRYRYLARVTTPGRFVWPPAKAEQMYAPEVFGHNAASWVEFP